MNKTSQATIQNADIINIDFEALKRDHWSEQETKNAKQVIDFVQQLMNNHDFNIILERYGDGPYLQHNKTIPDGINGVINTIKQLIKRFPDYTYDVKHIFVDGDYVTIHSHATLNKKHRGNDKKGLNIKDTWKLKDGKLVEHWDAVQPIDNFMRFYTLLTGGKTRNNNGVY